MAPQGVHIRSVSEPFPPSEGGRPGQPLSLHPGLLCVSTCQQLRGPRSTSAQLHPNQKTSALGPTPTKVPCICSCDGHELSGQFRTHLVALHTFILQGALLCPLTGNIRTCPGGPGPSAVPSLQPCCSSWWQVEHPPHEERQNRCDRLPKLGRLCANALQTQQNPPGHSPGATNFLCALRSKMGDKQHPLVFHGRPLF